MAERAHLDGLAARINEAYRRLQDAPGERALMLLAGELLSEAKAAVPEGAWLGWLDENFVGPVKVAEDLLALHRVERLVERALEFMSEDDNLTAEGRAARDRMLGDLEAIDQEHRLG